MKKLALLNTTILTADGDFSLRSISLEKAREMVDDADEIISAIGHQSTAEIMTALLDKQVDVNRINFKQTPEIKALCFKLNGRPEEGKILTLEEIEAIGYEFKLLEMR